ncbi:hypothetical protein [Levilactobacillus humaensis]|uniref:hypothetical protein n=1 Tax=Levilactobacillus humaensis TaxID=2950375 RepID=UPI0021C3FF18|nr:hypothetical protein [Levilactobacillus humaensis]
MQKQPMDPIIRHQTSRFSRYVRGLVLTALWGFVAMIVLANISFKAGWYSDTLVSLYLLFNLKAHADDHLLALMGLLLILVPIYAGWRWVCLRKEEH